MNCPVIPRDTDLKQLKLDLKMTDKHRSGITNACRRKHKRNTKHVGGGKIYFFWKVMLFYFPYWSYLLNFVGCFEITLSVMILYKNLSLKIVQFLDAFHCERANYFVACLYLVNADSYFWLLIKCTASWSDYLSW